MECNPHILHVVDRLAPGGAATALVETARHLLTSGQRHEILSLERPVAAAADYAGGAGLTVIHAEAPGDAAIDRAVEAADLVWVHGWSSPVLDAFLRRRHPPARWLIWLHVAGDTVPHILTPALAAFPDRLIATTPYTASLEAFAGTGFVLPGSDPGRFEAVRRVPAEGEFRVGYIGTVDAAKMHPDFVDLSRAAQIPHARFDIFGRGADEARLEREIAESGDARLRLRGWAADVPGVLAAMDVFGYPLARGSYATAELVLQEAMAAGVPPVILGHGAAVHLVEHERTGLIARDEADYPRCLERLAADPALRQRLGDAARRHALDHFGAARAARCFEPILRPLLAGPKRERVWPDPARSGSERFIAALGCEGAPFSASRSLADDDARRAADAWIAGAPPALASGTSGGVLHWRRFYPEDPWLRLWSALVHRGQGRNVPALGELLQARTLGLASPRVERYIAECSAAVSRRPEGE